MNQIKNILKLLTPIERKQLYILFFTNLIVAVLDMVGVASIMPFISLISNQQLIITNNSLKTIYLYFNFTSTRQFVFVFGIVVLILLIISIALKSITTYYQTKFALMREYTIGKRLVEGYLNQPYAWFLTQNSADLGKTILSEIQGIIIGCIMPMMIIISQGFVVFSLLILLLLVDTSLALIIGTVLISTYFIINKLMNGGLSKIGIERINANKERYVAVSEAFGGIKEVKVNGLEKYYIRNFSKPAEVYAKNQATAQVIAQIPRFLIEGIAFGMMLLILLYLIYRGENIGNILPIISLYAFAAYRLLPATQQVYGSYSQIKFSSPALDALKKELEQLNPQSEILHPHNIMPLNDCIVLDNISFTYPNSSQQALSNLNLKIKAHNTIGFVGSTGSGKTTTIDIILGILEAQNGSLLIDGVKITDENRRSWQNSIGFVPQQIYLADDTIASNIAFGVEKDKINYTAIEKASRIANLHDFVTTELPNGYDTNIGERGVRLSGGQRQRIGIARALYHNPQVLILDEATSALDNITENAVMEAINNIEKQITIIMVAHRLSTVRKCDMIYFIEHGVLKGQGTFEELKNKIDVFRTMAKS
jgi:ABC-type multidrug transport system fused ATPase/permease subunit